jgi:hypothetical protein
MATIPRIKALIKSISVLSDSLPSSVLNATKNDKIYTVITMQKDGMVFETFNKQFDTLFAEDCHNLDGCLHYIHQGINDMGLMCVYLNKNDWSNEAIPLDLVEIKLFCLSMELTSIKYVLCVLYFPLH